jgi:hypothetical protein
MSRDSIILVVGTYLILDYCFWLWLLSERKLAPPFQIVACTLLLTFVWPVVLVWVYVQRRSAPPYLLNQRGR